MAYFMRLLVNPAVLQRCWVKFLLTAIILLILIIRPSVSFGENRYVGSEACKGCHEDEYNNFIKYAKKSKSFESIERLRKGLTEEDLKACYPCHTTGYGKPGGFESPEKTPHLKNVGCEVCHGPGGAHIKSGNPKDIKRRLSIKDCEVCHTAERVTAFRYKPMIHGGAH